MTTAILIFITLLLFAWTLALQIRVDTLSNRSMGETLTDKEKEEIFRRIEADLKTDNL